MSITMGVNKSPFAGRSGAKLLTSRNIRDRLAKELEVNVALQVKDTGDSDTVQVFGRGLLHLTVLIESMRREGRFIYFFRRRAPWIRDAHRATPAGSERPLAPRPYKQKRRGRR